MGYYLPDVGMTFAAATAAAHTYGLLGTGAAQSAAATKAW
jgi:hypothetical protein